LATVLAVILAGSIEAGVIKGKVLDKNGAGIPQAKVKLLPGGITVTTGNDGRFSFSPSAAQAPQKQENRHSNSLMVSIIRGRLVIDFARKTSVAIAACAVDGRIIAALTEMAGPGARSIDLPRPGAGVYIYKVKTDNGTSVLKGVSLSQASGGSFALASDNRGGAPSFAKTVTGQAPADYTIEVTKEGYVDYNVTVSGSEEREIAIRPAVNEGTLTDADGNVYQTVKIGSQIWIAQNLRTTKYNDGEPIPYVPDTAQWGNFNIYESITTAGAIPKTHAPAPQFCYYNNTTDIDTIIRFGALYNWEVVRTGKLAPAGWRVPDTSDWQELLDYLTDGHLPESDILSQENLLAKTLAAGTYWNPSSMPGAIGNDYVINNGTGFAAMPAGWRTGTSQILYLTAGDMTYWWSGTEEYPNIIRCFMISNYGETGQVFSKTIWPVDFGLSIRLIKDAR
jgi:uncharacterized protein (TIGR02145 family)